MKFLEEITPFSWGGNQVKFLPWIYLLFPERFDINMPFSKWKKVTILVIVPEFAFIVLPRKLKCIGFGPVIICAEMFLSIVKIKYNLILLGTIWFYKNMFIMKSCIV